MKLTSVTSVTARSTRNVAGVETPATASGSTARTLANTNASTTSAPRAPIMASAITPLPGLAGVAFSSCRSPVTCTVQPAGAAAWTAPRDRDVRGLQGIGLVARREHQRERAAPRRR